MLPKNKSISALSNLNNISQLSGLPLNQLSNSLSSFHNLASNMQQFGQQLNNFSLNNLTQLTNASNLANLNSNLLLENLNLFNRSIDEREGCRSLICDNNGLIIGETTYRCMGCGKIHESIADIRQHFYEVHANSLLGNSSSNSNGTSVTDSTSGSSNNANNSMAAAAAAAAALISSSNSHNNNNNNNNNSANNLLNSALNSNNHSQSNNQSNSNSIQSQTNNINSNNNGTSNNNNNNNNNSSSNKSHNNSNNSSSGTQTPNNLTSLNGANSLKMAASSLLNGSLSGKDNNNNLNNSNSINNNLIGQLSPHNSLQALSVAQLSNSLQGALSANNSNNSTSDLFSLAGGASLLQPRKIKSEPQSQQQQQQIVAAKKRKIGDVVNKILNRNQTFLGNSTLFSDNQSVSNDVNQSPNDDQNIDQSDDLDENDEIEDEPAMDFDPWSQMLANAGQFSALNKIKGFDSNLLSSLGRGIGTNFDSNLDLGEGFSNGYFDFLQPKLEDISIKEESPRSIPSDLNLKRGCTTASVGKPGYIACAVCGVTRYYSCVYRRYGHFTCQVCYRFFRTFFSKPNKFGCAKLGECPLNVRVRCRACWIQACINTYTVDGQRKQILDIYKPIKSSNPNDSLSLCNMPQIGCEQQLTIGDPISSVSDMKQDQLSLHYSSLFNLGAINLSNNRASLNDAEDDEADPLEDESHGSLVMDEPEETNDAVNTTNGNEDSNQMNESSSPLNNKQSDSSPSANDDSNEPESDDLIRSCSINNEKAALSMLPGRQQLQRLLCQDLEKPLTAQDL